MNQVEPQQTAPLRDYLRSQSEEEVPPPLPNYSTYPGAVPPRHLPALIGITLQLVAEFLTTWRIRCPHRIIFMENK